MLPSPLSSTREEPDLTHLDLEELRSELVQCRLETGRMFTEQGRLAGLLGRFERLLTQITTSEYGTSEASVTVQTAVQSRPIALGGLSSGESYAIRSNSPQPSSPCGTMAVAHPSSPRMVSVGTRSPRHGGSVSPPPRMASNSVWAHPRHAVGQEYIVGHRQYTLVPPRRGTSSPSGRSSPALSPPRQHGVVRTLSPVPSPPMLARTAAALFPATSGMPASPGNVSPVSGGSLSLRRNFSPSRSVPTSIGPAMPVPTSAVAPAQAYMVSSMPLPLKLPGPEMVSNAPIIHSPALSNTPSYQGTPRAPLRLMHAVSRSVSPMPVEARVEGGRTSPPRVDLGRLCDLSPPSPRPVDRIVQSPSSSSFLQVVTHPDRTDSPRLKGGRGGAQRSDNLGLNEVPTSNGLPKSSSRSVQSGRQRGHERLGDRLSPSDARQGGVERSRSDQPFVDRSMRPDRPPAERVPEGRPLTERATRRGPPLGSAGASSRGGQG